MFNGFKTLDFRLFSKLSGKWANNYEEFLNVNVQKHKMHFEMLNIFH